MAPRQRRIAGLQEPACEARSHAERVATWRTAGTPIPVTGAAHAGEPETTWIKSYWRRACDSSRRGRYRIISSSAALAPQLTYSDVVPRSDCRLQDTGAVRRRLNGSRLDV